MIYFVRHGATDWNDHVNAAGEKDPKLQGRAEIMLNEHGREQARKMAQELQGVQFDRVICSPLKRARQTCALIYQGKVPVEIDERLIERDFGECEGKTRHEFDFADFCSRKMKKNYRGVESIPDVEKRVFSLLDELKQQPEQNVLLVSHGGVGCVVMSYFKGIPENGDYSAFLLPHGKPLCLDFRDMKQAKENDGHVL